MQVFLALEIKYIRIYVLNALQICGSLTFAVKKAVFWKKSQICCVLNLGKIQFFTNDEKRMKAKIYLIWTVAALVLATMACNFITSQPLPEGILFQDDFSNTSSGWDKLSSSESVTDYSNGVYRIWVNDTYTDVWANPGLSFTDTIIEVEATKVGGPDENNFGVICRYQDNANFYFFYISSDGYYAIGQVFEGQHTMIGQESMLPDDTIKIGNTTNNLRADCIGDKLTLYVNGSEIARLQDTTFSSGDVGLLAGTFDAPGTDIHFDNFVVRKP